MVVDELGKLRSFLSILLKEQSVDGKKSGADGNTYLWISAKGDPGGGGWSASWSEPLITGVCCGQVAPDIRGKNGALVSAGFLETKAGFPKNDDGAQRQRPLPGLSTAQSGTLFCLFSGMLGYSPASEMLWTVGEIRRVEMNIQCHHRHP